MKDLSPAGLTAEQLSLFVSAKISFFMLRLTFNSGLVWVTQVTLRLSSQSLNLHNLSDLSVHVFYAL